MTVNRLVIFGLLIGLLLSACNSEPDQLPATGTRAPHPTLTVTPGADAPNTFSASSGLQVTIPDGWVVREDRNSIVGANSEEALDADAAAPGQAGFMIMPPSMVGVEGGATARETLVLFMALDEGTTFGAVNELTLGGYPAAQASMRRADLEGTALALELDTNIIALFIGLASPGEFARFEPLLLEIAASITYRAP